MSQEKADPKELTPEQAKKKRAELARQQEDAARKADRAEDASEDATISTFVLPGD